MKRDIVKHRRTDHVNAMLLGPLRGGLAALLFAALPAHAAEDTAPVPPPPKAAAAAAPSPKAEDAPQGTKAGAAPAAPAAPAPPADSAPAAPPSEPPKVQGGPPPLYFVEPGGPDTPPQQQPPTVEEPGLPPPPTLVYEPPLPPEPRTRAPESAFWAGMRFAWFIPFGSVWVDSFDSRAGTYYRRRLFDDYASSGPSIEFDIGARLARRYNVFALMEQSFLGSGSLDPNAFGGQNRGRTGLYGAGIRFSTDATSIGFLLEIALGYREFKTSWNDGTALTLTGGFLDARAGIGADIRVNRNFSLSPMLVFGGGTFGTARWSGTLNGEAIDARDDLGQYGTFAVQLGGHFDIY